MATELLLGDSDVSQRVSLVLEIYFEGVLGATKGSFVDRACGCFPGCWLQISRDRLIHSLWIA